MGVVIDFTSTIEFESPEKGFLLTADQRGFVLSALAEFDSINLSVEDAESIVEAFAEAGIKPSKELSRLIISAGFSPLPT